MTRYRKQFVDFTGSWGWAEKWLGPGQSYAACVIIGILLFFISITVMFGLIDNILMGIFGNLVQQPRSR
jgi:hypothetical protein